MHSLDRLGVTGKDTLLLSDYFILHHAYQQQPPYLFRRNVAITDFKILLILFLVEIDEVVHLLHLRHRLDCIEMTTELAPD